MLNNQSAKVTMITAIVTVLEVKKACDFGLEIYPVKRCDHR
jgi:hypothetical protein